MATAQPRDTYSMANIEFIDGTTKEFMVKASPSVVSHLLNNMKSSEFLILWNDTATLCIRADQVKHFSMQELTNQPTEK